jgi:2-keto-4-pentenoate hydratase/2-oxohepta-3-ene-1,7-dioic acid hydratase in catechol pathway
MRHSIRFEERTLTPSKIVCVGRNYVEHIHELNNEIPDEIVLFLKPNSSLTERLFVPQEECRFEGELVFLWEGGAIAGVGLGLDLTKIEVQKRLKKKGLPWEKSKAFNHAAVVSEFVALPEEDLSALSLRLSINGDLRQEGGVELMMHKPAALLEEIQTHFALEDGDLIFSGTPKGVGFVELGQRFVGEVLAGERSLLQIEWVAEAAGN